MSAMPVMSGSLRDGALSQEVEEMPVDRKAMSLLLKELGIHLDTDLAPSFLLATHDVLTCIELADSLPDEADFIAACRLLQTIDMEQPEPVQLVQQAVARHYLASLDERARARMNALLRSLDL